MATCMFAGGSDVFNGYPGQDVVMHFTATVLLAFGMSMDAFAASIGKGATYINPNSQKRCVPVLSLARLKR